MFLTAACACHIALPLIGKYRSSVALLGGRVRSEKRSIQRADPTTIGKTVINPRKRTSVGGLGAFGAAPGSPLPAPV
jgi:hypothetical protein